MKVTITRNDIRMGKSTIGKCPLARALKRTTGKTWWVDQHSAYSRPAGDLIMVVDLARAARRFVRAFDDGRAKPCSFEVFE